MEPFESRKPATTIFFLFFCFVLCSQFSFSGCTDPVSWGYDCFEPIYASYSSYQSNLNTLLSDLSSNATYNSNNAYYNATVGQDPNVVYGTYYCRGDVTSDVCRDCVNFAVTDIVNRCPSQEVAVIYYEECTLRYSNQFIFSTVSDGPIASVYNVYNISDPSRFSRLLSNTLYEIAAMARLNAERFATLEVSFTQFQNLYSMGQCSPDLSGDDCYRCLVDDVIGTVLTYYSYKEGARAFNPSCHVRFEIYPFYTITASVLPPPPSPTELTPPPSSPTELAPPPPSLTELAPPPPSPTNLAPLTELAPSPSLLFLPAPRSKITGIKANQGSSSAKIVTIVVPAVAAGLISMAILLFLYLFVFGKKKEEPPRENGDYGVTSAESLQFDFDTVLTATNNFAVANQIGQGGFGAAYMGRLPNGQEIVVKRLSISSGQCAKEFKNEVAVLARLQHRNLVKVLGFCLKREERIIIYEFVPNKSLDHFLFDIEQCMQLDWQQRHKIIQGIARGCLYLHEDSRLQIIHRDLKASNILLDEEMNPKISDFGIARISGIDQTQQSTSRIVGTCGYISPEYALHGFFSVKSDVFSFGVLVLEIVSGMKNSSFHHTDFAGGLISHAWRHWNAGITFEFIDPLLREKCSRSEVTRSIHVALLCVQEDAAARPTMANIVLMLNSELVTLPLPSKPAFYVQSKMESGTSDPSTSSSSKPLPVNEDSVSFEVNILSR